MQLGYGAIALFHGAACRHYAPPNPSDCLRASLDFRVGVQGHFDPELRLEAKAQHSRRRVTLRLCEGGELAVE
jgi:hypothetical protein